MISTSSMSGNSISLDAATMTAMAANKQYMAAIAAMMSNILIMVDPPFRSLIQTLDLLPIETLFLSKPLLRSICIVDIDRCS